MKLKTALTGALISLAMPGLAATFDDPDWPCVQAKVLKLSVGQMWAGPEITDDIRTLARSEDIRSAAGPLVVRRNTEDEIVAMIDKLADDPSNNGDDQLTALFLASFNIIGNQRSQIVAGIGRYAHKQTGLSELIESKRQELVKLHNVEEKNFDRIEELEDTLVWDERIYKDRQQSLTYVCETPVLLEKRAFAIARAIMGHLD